MKHQSKKYERTVIFGDLHAPKQDDKAVALLIKFLEWYKPTLVISNGDFIDCETVSAFGDDPTKVHRLREEIEIARSILDNIEAVTPQATRYFTLGNHENRLQKFLIRKAPEIMELIALEDLLKITKQWIVVNESMVENYVQVNDLYIGHWNRVSKHSAYTVRNIIADRGVNVIQSHTHRMGMFTQRFLDRTVYGWEIGCLQDLNPSYVRNPNWQTGWAVIEPYNYGRQYSLYLIKVNDSGGKYSFAYGRKKFEV
jgi:hypothetical protein